MRALLAALSRVPAEARVLAGSLVVAVVMIGALAPMIAVATPYVTPPDPVVVAKDASRFAAPLDAVPVFFTKEDPWVVHVVPTISYRGDHYEKKARKSAADAENERIEQLREEQKAQKKKGNKRSDRHNGAIQLASVGNVSIGEQEIEATPVTLPTPFGTEIKTVVSLNGISPELTDFLKRVQSQCGKVTVISAFRRSGVPGTCHAKHQALDYQIDNPACALAVARSFRGGHSTDYYGVQAISRGMPKHFHVSNCSREMGARFVHRGSSDARVSVAKRSKTKKRVRYARRRTAGA